MSLRPLVKVSTLQNDAYLANFPCYTPAEASKIKKYVPKFLSFAGVDSHSHQEFFKQEIQKQKLKQKAIFGKDSSTNAELKFIGSNDINLRIWNDVCICLNVPFNNRQSSQQQKDQLESKIQLFVAEQLSFTNKKGEQLSKQSNVQIALENVDIFMIPTELPAENFDNSYRQIRFSLSVAAILPKRQTYSLKEISDAVQTDLLSSLKIMLKSKLPIRLLQSIFTQQRVLILQSFVAKREEIQKQRKKLSDLLNKESVVNNEQQPQRQRQVGSIDDPEVFLRPKSELSNRQLLLILLGLFFIYLFLKINPLQKILSQAL